MGSRGPKPLTRDELAARGSTLAASRGNDGMTPVVCLPPAPGWLSDAAKAHYATIGAELVELGVMARIHAVALGMLASAIAQLADLTECVNREGVTIDGPKGRPISNPTYRAQQKASDTVTRLMREFGLTPVSVERVRKLPQPPRADDQRLRLLQPKDKSRFFQ